MPTDWDKIASEADTLTNEKFKSEISNLTRLNNSDIENLISQTGVDKSELVKILKEIKDSTKSNNDKADAIKNIGKGLNVLIEIASKFI